MQSRCFYPKRRTISAYRWSLEQLQNTGRIRYNTLYATVIQSHEHIKSSSHSKHRLGQRVMLSQTRRHDNKLQDQNNDTSTM
uniref:Uncharacterized protein n=1 Tax=Anguilla anguilla TaxID=7936 RepID=A0A0E9WJM2_ANGAN